MPNLTYKQKFQMFARIYELRNNVRTECVEQKTADEYILEQSADNSYFVSFEEIISNESRHIIAGGYGKTIEYAYKRILKYLMEDYNMSEEELIFRYATTFGNLPVTGNTPA